MHSSTTGMSAVLGLGENDELYDWFIPEDKRPDLPLELKTGIAPFLAYIRAELLERKYLRKFQDMDTFPLGACIDYTRAKEDQNDILRETKDPCEDC